MPQTVLIVDDDPSVALGLATMLECDGRRLIVCRDLESAQLIVENEPVTDIVTDVRLTGAFRFEGLDFIADIRRVAPDARVILMTGAVSNELIDEAKRRGADAVLGKPFEVDVLEPLLSTGRDGGASSLLMVPTLDDILAAPQLRPQFQPIVTLASGGVHGVESLARFRGGPPFERPDLLFAYAGRQNRVADLEAACMARTLESAAALDPTRLLFINVHPAALDAPNVQAVIARTAARVGISLERVVVEITEQQPLRQHPGLFESIERLRALGVRFALDDVGVAYSHLPLIERIRPAYLKISQQFGTRFERDTTLTKIVRSLLSMAREFGCEVIIEGVEDASTADAARELGIAYAQGYLFGRPSDGGELTTAAL